MGIAFAAVRQVPEELNEATFVFIVVASRFRVTTDSRIYRFRGVSDITTANLARDARRGRPRGRPVKNQREVFFGQQKDIASAERTDRDLLVVSELEQLEKTTHDPGGALEIDPPVVLDPQIRQRHQLPDVVHFTEREDNRTAAPLICRQHEAVDDLRKKPLVTDERSRIDLGVLRLEEFGSRLEFPQDIHRSLETAVVLDVLGDLQQELSLRTLLLAEIGTIGLSFRHSFADDVLR